MECLKDIEEGRIKDFVIGKDKLYCNKCVSQIDIDTLAIESFQDNTQITLEEATEELMIEFEDVYKTKWKK